MFYIQPPYNCPRATDAYEGLRIYAAMDAFDNAIERLLSIGKMWHETALPMIREMLADNVNENISDGRAAWEVIYADIEAHVARKHAVAVANHAVDAVVNAVAK